MKKKDFSYWENFTVFLTFFSVSNKRLFSPKRSYFKINLVKNKLGYHFSSNLEHWFIPSHSPTKPPRDLFLFVYSPLPIGLKIEIRP